MMTQYKSIENNNLPVQLEIKVPNVRMVGQEHRSTTRIVMDLNSQSEKKKKRCLNQRESREEPHRQKTKRLETRTT